MAKEIKEYKVSDFSKGLNTQDSTITMPEGNLQVATNVIYEPTGEVKSVDGWLQVGDDMTVNSEAVTKILGGCYFNGKPYLMASNGTIARLIYLNGSTWTQANAQNFDKDADVQMVVYNSKLWFVNGLTTNSNILHFLNTSNTLTGLTAAATGMVQGINRLILHLERMWISVNNNIYVSRQYPQGTALDWDNTAVYTGANTAGLIQLDDDTEDEILQMVTQFGQLVIFREKVINVVTGSTVLTSTVQKAFNSRGIRAFKSVAKADKVIYIYAPEGFKNFEGISVKEGTTEFDSVATDTIDRAIRPTIDAVSDKTAFVGHAYKDRYYVSDADTQTFVFDEKTGGWSVWDVGAAELFLEDGGLLYAAKGNKYYQVNADSTANVTSEIKTKDFDLGIDAQWKLFEKLILLFRTASTSNAITINWYIDGATGASGTLAKTIEASAVKWDGTYQWDGTISWNNITINFKKVTQRKLKSGVTISIGISATGTNRFFFGSLSLLYEIMRREVR